MFRIHCFRPGWLVKENWLKRVLWNHRVRKNQVKHGKYGSIVPPSHFPSEATVIGLSLDDKRAPLTRPGIYPQNFSVIYTTLNCKVFWKTTKECVGLFEFHKKRNFFSLIKKYVLLGLTSPCINLPCPFQKRPSYFLHFCQV